MKIKDIIFEFKHQNYKNFDTFYRLTERQVYFAIVTISKDQDVTKDLMQDTYMKFIEKIDQFNDQLSVYAYLTTIGRNLAINEYNRRKRDIHDEQIFDYIPSPNKVDENEGILDILDTLDDIKRDIVVMHVINDLKFREIAKVLTMPLGTVQWHYHEAIKILKEKVGDVL
ncbi:MAG: RNA polymerase sigma factor [Acholeplasmataceae bacterium]